MSRKVLAMTIVSLDERHTPLLIVSRLGLWPHEIKTTASTLQRKTRRQMAAGRDGMKGSKWSWKAKHCGYTSGSSFIPRSRRVVSGPFHRFRDLSSSLGNSFVADPDRGKILKLFIAKLVNSKRIFYWLLKGDSLVQKRDRSWGNWYQHDIRYSMQRHQARHAKDGLNPSQKREGKGKYIGLKMSTFLDMAVVGFATVRWRGLETFASGKHSPWIKKRE